VDIKTGQAPVIPYMSFLYNMINEGKVDPSDIVTHKLPLDQAKHGYEVFDTKTEDCIKVILKPKILSSSNDFCYNLQGLYLNWSGLFCYHIM
jgi:hypothetical protein